MKPSTSELLSALDQRLSAAAAVLLPVAEQLDVVQEPGAAAAHFLPRLVALCNDPARSDIRWLVLTAVFGAFPTIDEVNAFTRTVELAAPGHAESALLAQLIKQPRRGRLDMPIMIASDAVVVDVTFCANNDLHTGIQRVVRETLPRWRAEHNVLAVAWDETSSIFRTLTATEDRRVFAHHHYREGEVAGTDEGPPPQLVVPWAGKVVETEVSNRRNSPHLAALAKLSGNTMSMIAYDMIPITTADLCPPAVLAPFGAYLTVVKHADRVAAISRSTAAEFAGFTHGLSAQGLHGPEVREIRLADESLRDTVQHSSASPKRHRPVMLCLGKQEPHKNQRAALHAAERLWSEGLEFEVRIAGAPGWGDPLRHTIKRLTKARHQLVELGRLSDARLLEEMKSADFVFFASLHEGYGLPISESLACGTPVITSNFGSQAEIAELGGCLTVDPRDDDDIARAVRLLVSSPDELSRLRIGAAARPVRTWDEYSSDLWEFLVAGKTSS